MAIDNIIVLTLYDYDGQISLSKDDHSLAIFVDFGHVCDFLGDFFDVFRSQIILFGESRGFRFVPEKNVDVRHRG